MSVTILINEEQRKRILIEGSGGVVSDIIKKNYLRVKEILSSSSEQIGLNLQFLITWGASIGGMVGPVEDFIRGSFPDISDLELSLLLTGIISSYYIDNKDFINKIFLKIKEVGLSDTFKIILKKSDTLLSTFLDFISSLGITFHKVTNILSYTFIIPLIPMIYNMVSNQNFTPEDISQILVRTTSFGLLTVSGIVVKELINKMVRRFSKN
jgi:hypothetical protein